MLFGALDRARRHRRRLGAGLAPSSARATRPSARRSRSATRSRRRSCSSAASSCSSAGCSSRCRTSAPPGLTSSAGGDGVARARSGSTSTSRGCRCARPTWSRSRSWSPSPRSGCSCVVEPARRRRGARGLRALGDRRGTAIGDGHRHAAGCASSRGDELVGDMPVAALVDDCPLYDLEPGRAGAAGSTRNRGDARRATPSPRTTLLALLGSPNIASQALGASSSTTRSSARAPCAGPRRPTPPCCCCPRPAARSRSRSTATAAASPATRTRGTVEAVLECAANLACVGAEPLGLTNCLNFGNPEKPHIAWQLDRARSRGLGDACRALGVPVVGGNVSLYNEGADGPDLPDAGRRHGRRAARPGAAPGLAFARGRRDRPGRPLRALARRLRAGQAARRARHGPAAAADIDGGRRRLRARPRRGPRRARSPPPTTSATAASPARWPSGRSPPERE